MYNNRSRAREEGNTGLAYVLKILMKSLYGRFGINPRSTISEICTKERYEELLTLNGFKDAHPLVNGYWLCSYLSYDSSTSSFINQPPRNSAVQIAAAITAHARIHMYPHISRPDCYYTDTDSLVRSNTLPNDMISTTELGKFKFEYMGIFLAPKSYCIIQYNERSDLLVHKGAAKQHVTREWYIEQYNDRSHVKKVTVTNPFTVDLKPMSRKDLRIYLSPHTKER